MPGHGGAVTDAPRFVHCYILHRQAREAAIVRRIEKGDAEIPAIIAVKWLNELGVNLFDSNHWPAVKRLLRDPDWKWLRSSPGRI